MGCSSFLTPSTALRIVYARSILRTHLRGYSGVQKPLLYAPLPNLWRKKKTVRLVLAESQAPSTSGLTDESVSDMSGLGSLPVSSSIEFAESVVYSIDADGQKRRLDKEMRRQSERTTYLFAAVASTVGITFLAAGAVYYRFAWQTQGAEIPFFEIFATFSLAIGASVGMEFWARWAHKALWHDSLWSMHESHHRPRDGPFEMNDIFAIINAVPAIALMAYGFFHKGLVPGLCFGAGLGITVFGMAYMFVHDGLVHRRFPVGPIGDVPYFQKVAAAHQLHHADKFRGVPFGLFLGPQELEARIGGAEELEKMIQIRKRLPASK
ncbi:hypothetical protein GOP47_0022333 [Adiantum capillus-veneris]|uniref:beta-carotene 3-hydroxylase n=1 Tax=Adiantum capillus-veneris TaxID=13818 RepID=A0A9D4Z590_ADICA|nr:hypothetical protein GOP47_0022333 [Adiantum capillus-veneris]